MSSKKSAIRRQFDRSAAGSYDKHAFVQRMMADRLQKSLIGWKSEADSSGLDILEIGCGTGTLTERLVNEWPSASITALDLAPAMIEAAKRRILSSAVEHADSRNRGSARLRLLHADVEQWVADSKADSFDLIVSNACFQWLSDPAQTLHHLRRMLRVGGLLAFTTFGPDTFRELHLAFQEAYQASGMEPQRHGLSFQSAAGWKRVLEEAGFSQVQCVNSIHRETYASPREFLHAVKAMGASASEAADVRGLSPRRLFAGMYKAYENRFCIQGGVAATYELLLNQAHA